MKSYANNEYFSIKMIPSIHECNIDIIHCINDSFIAFIYTNCRYSNYAQLVPLDLKQRQLVSKFIYLLSLRFVDYMQFLFNSQFI